MITVILTSSTEHFRKRLESAGDIQVMDSDVNNDGKRVFPDGEAYARLSHADELAGRVIILHSGAPYPNRGLLELEMLIEIVRNSPSGVPEIFFTYFPYGMQDAQFQIGEINVADNIFRKLTSYYGIKKIYTVDLHCAGKLWMVKYPVVNVSALELLRGVASQEYPDAVFVTPDSGHERRTGIKGAKKTRIHSYHSELHFDDTMKSLVVGKTVAVVDDILETGGTLDHFYDECKKYGAKELLALIAHGILRDGINRITKKYKQ